MCQLTLHKYKILIPVAMISLLTDLGVGSSALATLKGQLCQIQPCPQLVDIHHHADTQNYFAPAFLLRSYFRQFPEQTIHLVAVDVHAAVQHVLAVCEGRYFIAADNGILPLALDGFDVSYHRLNSSRAVSVVPRDLYVPALRTFMEQGFNTEAVAIPFRHVVQLSWQQPYHMGDFVRITVLYNDDMGNAHTNLDRAWVMQHLDQKSWRIKIGYNDYLAAPSEFPQHHQPGTAFAQWSENDFLMLSIQGASIASLLGFRRNHDIMIEFDTP